MRIRKSTYLMIACLAFGLNVSLAWAGGETAAVKPNIIFILADDLGYGDLGCYGQQRIRTPNLDRMAAEGMRFTQAYAGSTVCAPSRSVLMTGQHTGHTRVRGNARVPLLPEDVTVAEVLRDAGYKTALIGKWGLGEPGSTGIPTQQGFDYFFGYLNQRHAHNYYPEFLWRNETKVPLGNEVISRNPPSGVATKRVAYSHDLFIDETLKFIDENQSQPFFLYLAATIPHANNEAGGGGAKLIPDREGWRERAGMEIPQLGDYADEDWPAPEKGRAAMITHLDRGVGQIIQRLKQLGLERNTLIIFTSDNGPHSEGNSRADFFDSSGPLKGIKRSLHDGGIRVPAIAYWPGVVPAASESDMLWSFADFLPTAAEMAGVEPTAGLDGISLRQTLQGESQDWSERVLYWEFHERNPGQAIRWGKWKAIKNRGKSLQLFDMTTDIGEEHNLADENPDVAKQALNIMSEARTASEHWGDPQKKTNTQGK